MSWISPLLAGVTIGVLLQGFPCRAQQEESEETRVQRFKLQYAQAGKSYAAGDFAAAIPALQAAYAIQPLPPLLFNIAQAYRRMELWSSARVYFELYRHVDLNMPKETSLSIDSLVAEAREKEIAEHTPKVVEKTKLLYVQQEKPLPRWLRPFGVTTGLLGLGAIGAGAGLWGINGRCTQDPIAPALECEQVYQTRTPGIALVAAGGAVLAIGIVTLSLSLKKPSKPVVATSQPPDMLLPNVDKIVAVKASPIKDTAVAKSMRSPVLVVPEAHPTVEPPPAGSMVAPKILETMVPSTLPNAEPPPTGFRPSGRRSHRHGGQ